MATGERRSVWNVPRSDLIRQERRVAIRPGYEGSGKARFGRHGWAMHGREGWAVRVPVWKGSAGLAGQGTFRLGIVWSVLARRGQVWQVRLGLAVRGDARPGIVRLVGAWPGRQGVSWIVPASRGVALSGVVRQARCVMLRLVLAVRGEVSHGSL